MKSIGVAHVTPSAFQRLADAAIILADYEGFPAHAMALRERLDRQK
jgi:histidinol dehydrogenase